MASCQYLVNVFTPFPLTAAHRQHPTHPSRVDDIIAAPAFAVTLHTAGRHLPPKQAHVYSNPNTPTTSVTNLQKVRGMNCIKYADCFGCCCRKQSFARSSVQRMRTLNTNWSKSEKRPMLPSFPCSRKRSAVAGDEHSAPSWWWTQQLMKIELLELKSNV